MSSSFAADGIDHSFSTFDGRAPEELDIPCILWGAY
jgi:hypothetical protein